MPSDVPSEVQRLLEGAVDSFEKLEILVAVAVTPEMRLGLSAIADHLKLELRVVRQSVIALEESGLVRCDEQGDIRLVSPALIASLVTAYDQDRLGIVMAISDIAMRRIRGLTARAFANAFDLTKKRGDGDG